MRAAVASVALLGAIVAGAWAGAGATPAGGASPPNVVVITTDDQDAASLAVMPETRQRIGAAGATFTESFTNFPLCCPSRATFLTGQYSQNHGVHGNRPPRGGFQAFEPSRALPVWLEAAGYHTALFGKYLNGYEAAPLEAPPGWSEWRGMRSYHYYGQTLLEGFPPDPLALNQYGSSAEDPDDPADPGSYGTDVLTEKAVSFLGERTPAEQPFFLWLSYLAPHGGGPKQPDAARCPGTLPKPAVRHRGEFDDAALPAPPSLNEANVSDKPPAVRRVPRLTKAELARLELAWRCHRESLLAVDEGVAAIVDAIEGLGEADNTLIIFTSDNGLMFGEHRYFRQKNWPYEESIRVPLLIRGPGFEPGTRVRELAFNVDLAPTILDVTGVKAGLPQDGRSLVPLARDRKRRRGRELLIRGPELHGLRNARFTYARRTASAGGGVELYDLRRDPFQLRSLHRAKAYEAEREALHRRLKRLRGCEGRSCRRRPRLGLRVAPPRCKRPRVRIRAVGADAAALARVRFVGSGGRADRRAPFQVQVARRAIGSISARATLRDGRVLTLPAAQRPRCRPQGP